MDPLCPICGFLIDTPNHVLGCQGLIPADGRSVTLPALRSVVESTLETRKENIVRSHVLDMLNEEAEKVESCSRCGEPTLIGQNHMCDVCVKEISELASNGGMITAPPFAPPQPPNLGQMISVNIQTNSKPFTDRMDSLLLGAQQARSLSRHILRDGRGR